MDVAVDKAGKKSESRGVDCFRIAWDLSAVALSDLGDAPIFNEDDRPAGHLTGGWIQEGVAENGADHQPMLKRKPGSPRMHALACH